MSGATALFGQVKPAPKASSTLVDSTRSIMQADELSLKGTTPVFGDPAKTGAYIVRMKLAPNQAGRPRFDDQDRFITVLKGTLWIGKGDVYTPGKLLPIREDGVGYLPANTHYYYVAGEDEVILQITGNGPVKTTHSELDAKGMPVPVGGPYPNLTPTRRKNPVDADLLTPDQLEQMERDAAAAKAAAAKKAATSK